MSVSTIQLISQLPRQKISTSSPDPINKEVVFKELLFEIAQDVSLAVAMSDEELACFYAIKFVLCSHTRLSKEDIEHATNYISSFYIYSRNEENSDEENIITEDHLVQFLVYTNQRGIGKFALIFNDKLDFAIISRDNIFLQQILFGPKEMFVELYDNPYLFTEDYDFMIRLISREMYAMTLLLKQFREKILNLEIIDDTCQSKGENQESIVTIAAKCYDKVCLQDVKILESDSIRVEMSKYETLPNTVHTVDKSKNSMTPQVYCFDTIELIASMTENIPVNSRTKEPFSEYSLKVIGRRFHKEIALYRRYKELRSTSQ